MNLLIKTSILGLFCLLFVACKKDKAVTTTEALDSELETILSRAANGLGTDFFALPESDDFGNIPQDPKNPISKEKVALGQLLYHETGLAMNPKIPISRNTYSCASCHFAEAGFQAGRHQGIGEGGEGMGMAGLLRINSDGFDLDSLDVQPIRSPSTLNVAYQTNMLWNGQFGATGTNIGTEEHWKEGTPIFTNFTGFEGVEIQAIAGLGVHRLAIDSFFLARTGYQAMFDEVYGDLPTEERYTKITAGMAIAAYERTLLPNKAPFQDWLNGNKNALTAAQKLGAIAFFDKGGCVNCHTGPGLNKMAYEAIGMKDLFESDDPAYQSGDLAPANLGRGGFNNKDSDKFKFKIPQLYNLKDSPFYGHGSSFKAIEEVVNYKNEAIPENSKVTSEYLSPSFKPLGLTTAEVNNIADFIGNGLHDPNLSRYVPTSLPSGLCFPSNDPKSRKDLGCD